MKFAEHARTQVRVGEMAAEATALASAAWNWEVCASADPMAHIWRWLGDERSAG